MPPKKQTRQMRGQSNPFWQQKPPLVFQVQKKASEWHGLQEISALFGNIVLGVLDTSRFPTLPAL